MCAYYMDWFKKYPFVSIEDPFDQDDWPAYSHFTALCGKEMQVATHEQQNGGGYV